MFILIFRYPQLKQVYNNKNTFVLYPTDTAISLNEFKDLVKAEEDKTNTLNEQAEASAKKEADFFHAIIVDGTWSQASGIYWTNHELQKLKQV